MLFAIAAKCFGGSRSSQMLHRIDMHASEAMMPCCRVGTNVRESEVTTMSTKPDTKARVCVINGEFRASSKACKFRGGKWLGMYRAVTAAQIASTRAADGTEQRSMAREVIFANVATAIA